MTREKYWAVRIGRSRANKPYFAVERIGQVYQPVLFKTKSEARHYRAETLRTCGHKDVFVVPVELKQAK